MNKFVLIDNFKCTPKIVTEMPIGSTAMDYIKNSGINPELNPVMVLISNNQTRDYYYLSRNFEGVNEWETYKLNEHEECYVIISPNGDGFTTALIVSLIISVVIGVGTYLLTPRPNLGQNQLNLDSSPTYDLSQQGNRARIGQPIPIHYGTMRAYPDICSYPYSYSVYPDKNYYKVALCVGQGHIQVSDERIDDTPLSKFPWVVRTVTVSDGSPVTIGGFSDPMITSKEVKNYLVDAVDQAIQTKANVVRASDVHIDISAPGALIDGYVPVLNDTFLLMNENNQSENGTWIYDTATTPMTRVASLNQPSEFLNAVVPVTGGTYAGQSFIQLNNISAVGVDPVEFTAYDAGEGVGDYFILNDTNDVSKVLALYFDFICPQGVYALGLPTVTKPTAIQASPINVNISAPGLHIDGIPASFGNKYLLQNQTIPAENGLYVYDTLSTPMIRDATMNTAGQFTNALVPVSGGTYGGMEFRQTATITTLGVDPVIFVPYDSSNTFQTESIELVIYMQEIDNTGADVGSPIIGYESISGATNQPIYRTMGFFPNGPIAPGRRYKGKVLRKYAEKYKTDTNYMDKVEWVGFRGSFNVASPTYLNKTFLVITAQASGKLNNSNIGIWNCLGKRVVWTYDFGTATWAKAQTNSPIWAWWDLASNGRGEYKYGIGLDETTQLDLANAEDIYDSINGLGLECNTRFDTAMGGEEMLAQICQAMRCVTYKRGGKWLLARDEEKSFINGFFSRENIAKNSLTLSMTPKNEFSPTWFRVTYFDETSLKKETVDCVIPSALTALQQYAEPVEEIEFHTITNRTKAWQEGMHLCAQNAYRNELIKFSTDREGYFPNPMDHIAVNHPMITNNSTGYVQKVIGEYVYLSEPVEFFGYATGLISFKKLDGTVAGPYICAATEQPYKVLMIKFTTATPDYTLFPFLSQADEPLTEETTYTFGTLNSSYIAVVSSITPSGENECSIEAVKHDPRVHMLSKPIFLVPDLGGDYILHDEFICGGSNNSCIVNMTTKNVDVDFDYSGYKGYVVRYTFNVAGVENTITQTVYDSVAGVKSANYVYPTNPPAYVRVTPIIDITISPVLEEELTALTVTIPIQLTV